MSAPESNPESLDTTRSAGPPPVAARYVRGAALGRFLIVDRLGGGGMGTVYSAFDPVLGREVAIKVLHATSVAPEHEASHRARIEREAQAMARIKHPNVVTIYDVGDAGDGRVFLAMERVDGGTLAAWLREPRAWREVVRVFCEAGDGLVAAHRAGVIHRDFKPDNVLMDASGMPRVTDFGLARAGGEAAFPSAGVGDGAGSASLSEPLTLSGAILGTPGYMAPEQYAAAPIDERADVFAFCVSLYRALYRERPFEGKTAEELAVSTINGSLRPPPKGTAVPAWVQRALLHGLATEREDRPASMAALLAQLRDDPAVRRRRAATALIAGLALLAGGWVARTAAERHAHRCDGAGDRVAALWNATRKAQIAAAFADTKRGYADEALRQVERTLDGYAAAWSSGAIAACAATRVRGEQSEQMLDLRQGCLDDRLGELRALVDVLSTADAKVVEKAPRAARELSPVDSCTNVDRLSALARMPTDPAARAEIRALQDDLAKAKELREAGRKVKGKELLDAIADRVQAAGWGPLLLTWHQYRASMEKQGDEKAAVADYEAAIALAERYHADERKAGSEIMLGSYEGSWLGRSEDAHMWLRMASETIARLGGDPRLEIYRDEEEAWVYQYEHKLDEAAPLFERVLERAQAAGAADPDTVASAHSGISEALRAAGKNDEAVGHALVALRTTEEGYGRESLSVPGYLNNLAIAEMSAGRPLDALASVTRGRELIAAQAARGDIAEGSASYGLALHTTGEVLVRLRRYDEAAAALEQARAVYVAAHGGANADAAYADNEAAEAYLALGRSADATRTLADAAAMEKEVSDVPAAIIMGTLAARSRAALDRGEVRVATELAERALASVKEGEASPLELAGPRLALARALARSGGDPDRARTLASQARDAFAADHDDVNRALAAEIAAGAAARPPR